GLCAVSYSVGRLGGELGKVGAFIGPGGGPIQHFSRTGLSAAIGLAPAAISTGIGSQVQQPLACVIVGGMLLSPICSLLVIPTLARMFMPYLPDRVATPPQPEGDTASHAPQPA